MVDEHAVTNAAIVTEISIGISPVSSEANLPVKPDDAVPASAESAVGSAAPPLVSTRNQFMSAIGFDNGVGEDQRFSRLFFGTFADSNMEADYERERPGINVVNGHRQLLLLHGALTILRPLLFGKAFYSELDGRYEEDFLFSMLLVTLSCIFLITFNVLFHCWKTEFAVRVTPL